MPIECQCVNYINLTLHILNSDLKTDTFTSITQSTCKSLSIAYIYIYIYILWGPCSLSNSKWPHIIPFLLQFGMLGRWMSVFTRFNESFLIVYVYSCVSIFKINRMQRFFFFIFWRERNAKVILWVVKNISYPFMRLNSIRTLCKIHVLPLQF